MNDEIGDKVIKHFERVRLCTKMRVEINYTA